MVAYDFSILLNAVGVGIVASYLLGWSDPGFKGGLCAGYLMMLRTARLSFDRGGNGLGVIRDNL